MSSLPEDCEFKEDGGNTELLTRVAAENGVKVSTLCIYWLKCQNPACDFVPEAPPAEKKSGQLRPGPSCLPL